MLLEFKIANFRSIGVGQTLSFIASSDPAHPSHVARGEELKAGLGVLRSLLVYGANASGKSNLCRALFYMRRLVLTSATQLNDGDELRGIEPFILNSSLQTEPTSLEVTVSISGDIYRYGFEASEFEIHREWLYLTRKAAGSREILLFEREGLDKERWHFGPAFKGRTRDLRDRCRATNCLLLSKASQESYEQLIPLYAWFRDQLRIVNMTNSPKSLVLETARRCHSGVVNTKTLSEMLKVADAGIVEIDTELEHVELTEDVRSKVSARNPEASVPKEVDRVRFAMVREQTDTNDKISIDFSEESSGTQRFAAVSGLLLEAFKLGQVLILDELECSLHPMLTRQIWETMNEADLGVNTPQFIVATHDSNLLDFDIVRRDQVFLVEKGSDQQTEVFSLYDLDPRPKSDAAAEKQYLSQRFGGTPRLGNLRLAIASALAADPATAVV